tara:strand:+ start:587 stop:763 length:177 start_codon:yes stop_codon:yes gene_type:complete
MSYRKRFPKGKDWKDPKPGEFNSEGLRVSSNAYHGVKEVGVSIKKYKKLKKVLFRIIK